MGEITIITDNGPETIEATIVGALASHADIDCPDTLFRVSHISTGLAIPYAFLRRGDATKVARKLNKIIDWDAFIRALAKGQKDKVIISNIYNACEEFGGWPTSQTDEVREMSNNHLKKCNTNRPR